MYRHRWLLAITVAALVLRLHWNLMVHPLGDYVVSDMRGYDVRSTQLLTNPWKKIEYHGFFPYGAHYVVAAVKWLFGRYNYPAISVAYALMGTITVSLAYLIAARVSRHAWVPPLLGLILIPYYPIISLGGYMLSETPFAVFLMAAMITVQTVLSFAAMPIWIAIGEKLFLGG